jgi:hypothetical protein
VNADFVVIGMLHFFVFVLLALFMIFCFVERMDAILKTHLSIYIYIYIYTHTHTKQVL